jgi:PAS domain S-box-containing protein
MNKINSISEIVSIRTLEKIQDNFSEATGIGCRIYNLKGEAITKFSRQSRLCKFLRGKEGYEECIQEVLMKNFDKCIKSGQAQTVQLHTDTYSFIVPVSTDAGIIGFLVSGLSRFSNPVMVNCVKEADKLGISLDTYMEMFLELSLVTAEKLDAAANLLKIITTSISHLAKEGSVAKARVSEMISINDILEKEVEMASLELKENQERYRRIFNTVLDGIYETDMDGVIRDINPSGAKMAGYARVELIGKPMTDLYIIPEERKVFLDVLTKDGNISHFYPRIRHKNGSEFTVDANAVLQRDQDGNPVGVHGIFRRVSVRDHANLKENANTIADIIVGKSITNK